MNSEGGCKGVKFNADAEEHGTAARCTSQYNGLIPLCTLSISLPSPKLLIYLIPKPKNVLHFNYLYPVCFTHFQGPSPVENIYHAMAIRADYGG